MPSVFKLSSGSCIFIGSASRIILLMDWDGSAHATIRFNRTSGAEEIFEYEIFFYTQFFLLLAYHSFLSITLS